MDKRTINKAINFLKEELISNGVNVNGIALFGSQMSGNATEESDLDLIIISDTFKRKDIFERCKLTMNAEWNTIKKFKIPMDILTMTPKEYETAINNKRYEATII
ncbi:MAG: nucleotidyltransferase domain-containing protein [Bacteroidota bacterium]